MSDQTPEDAAPKVIDLQAEEIRAEAETPAFTQPEKDSTAEPQTDWTPPAPRNRRGGAAKWIIAGLILGAIGGGWLYRDVLSSYLPSDGMIALTEKVAALEVNTGNLASQLAALQQTAQGAADTAAAAKDASSAAAAQSGKADEGLAALAAKLQATDQRLSAAEDAIKAAAADLGSFRKSLSSAGSASGSAPVDTAALAALAQRIDALEKDVAGLKSGTGVPGQANATAALSQALSDLKAKVAAGTSYAAESERISRMAPAAAGLDVVSSFAADGVPTAQQLAEQLTALIPSLPEAAKPAADDNSYFGWVMKSLSGIITIREIGDTGWRQVAEKAEAFAEAGDLTQAIAAIDSAEGDKPVALAHWRDMAAARLQLDGALEQLSEAVLRQIAAQAGAP